MSENTKKTFAVHTLGCRTNQYESQGYASQLLAKGYTQVGEGEEPGLCIVNSCTVTASADLSSHQLVRQLQKKYPHTQIVVTGCAAEKDPKRFASLPGVLRVISNKEKEQLLPLVFPEEQWPEFSITQFEAHTRAFVKVQDGCNSFCTYCIIPYVRGRSRSRSVEDIVREVHTLVDSGFKEIVLTGINIGDFDGDPAPGEPPTRLATLVRAIDAIEGVKRLRISSIDPDEVDDDLMEAVLQGRSTCPSFHIVLQSGSNAILKRMNRKYTSQLFLNTIGRLQKSREDFTFTTDVIVGFPGETDKDLEDTLAILRTVQFAKVHMFPYSKREKTRAALYPDHLSAEVIQERKRRVLTVAEETAFALRNRYVGQRAQVLIEGKEEQQMSFGHTEHFLPVLVRASEGPLHANQLVEVLLEENSPEGLIGRVVACSP
ncbi:MAG: tRNA (N(6)-L-threonylcarbamoyladenosine(37)-C(2))-methylthiotransferase MtaB [Chlamydiae bacterium]|nr:tRNA (N(6)-L-threonylcarbamoyladenosine(37)-C(2))-methylthiotransferase MtaB [Chlamydiota bacterium]